MNDNSLVIRVWAAKISHLVARGLNESLGYLRASGSHTLESLTDLDDPHKLALQFRPFEKILLDETLALAQTCNIRLNYNEKRFVDELALAIFHRWSWAHDVMTQIYTGLDPEECQIEHGGNKAEAFESIKVMISNKMHDDYDDKRRKRREQLLEDNQNFALSILDLNHESVRAVPHAADIHRWRQIAMLFWVNSKIMSQWPGFSAVAEQIENGRSSQSQRASDDKSSLYQIIVNEETSKWREVMGDPTFNISLKQVDVESNEQIRTEDEGGDNSGQLKEAAMIMVDQLLDLANTWDVWRFCRMLRLTIQRTDNALHTQEFAREAEFSDIWQEVRHDRDNDDECYLEYQPVEQYEGQLLATVSKLFEYSFLQEITLAYRTVTRNRALDDPAQYLEYIPWSELQITEICPTIREFINQLNLPPALGNAQFFFWNASIQEKRSRTYYINEEIFEHTIVDNFEIPGFNLKDSVLLVYQSECKRGICKDFRKFWYNWNDIAIMKCPENDEWIILETLPGIKSRQLRKNGGYEAPGAFMSSVFRYHFFSGDQKNQVRAILGDDYDPMFAYMLQFIDPRHLSSLCSKPIGEGSFGQVYKATWSMMPSHITTDLDTVDTVVGDVALKRSLQPGEGNIRDRRKFIQELKTVYTALSGSDGAFLRFFGFTRLFIDKSAKAYLQAEPGTEPQLLLVFEYASEGSVLSFMEHHLVTGEVAGNWDKFISALDDVASGIEAIHARSVIHRDIHPNNVLVSPKYFASSHKTEYKCLLSDLGEGKTIQSASTGSSTEAKPTLRNIGIKSYRAPEVPTLGCSKASDVYAMGQLGFDILCSNWNKFRQHEGGPVLIPDKFLHILEICKNDDPEKRPPAVSVNFMHDELVGKFNGDALLWVDSDKLAEEGRDPKCWASSPLLDPRNGVDLSTFLSYSGTPELPSRT